MYPDANCFYLKTKLSEVTGLSNEQILIGNGSDELLKLIAETFLNAGDQVVFADPSFVEYEFTAKIMGADCIMIPLVDFKHDLPTMLASITDKTKIVYICNPNNPTGTIVTKDEIAAFMSQVPEHVLVIFDEAYIEYVENPDFISGLEYLNQGRNVIVLRTFSKIYGLAALRVGYGLTTTAIAQAVERVTEPFNVNMLAQIAATAALGDHAHVSNSQRVNSQGKQYLYNEFEKMGLSYVRTEANFIFVNVGRDCKKVFKDLLSLGIIVRTGDIFGFPTFIRVTIGSADENERFIAGLKEVLSGSV